MTQLNEAINNDLAILDTWLQGNKLSSNVAKTQSMLITTQHKQNTLKNTNQSLELFIRDNELDVVPKTKYLGVQIDSALDWKEHIKTTSAKVSKAVGFIKYAKKYVPDKTFKTLYTSIAEPHFQYCCSVWGCCGITQINQLQKLQNRAARIITNSSFDTPSRPLIELLGWKTIEQLIDSQSKTIVFKSLNGQAPQYMESLFKRNSQCSTHSLRNTETDLRLPKKTSANGQNCSHLGVQECGIAFQLSQKRHSPLMFSRDLWDLIYFYKLNFSFLSFYCKYFVIHFIYFNYN